MESVIEPPITSILMTVGSNSSAELAQPGEVDENSDVESDSDVGELNLNDSEFLDDDNDGVLEEMISDGDDDYGD